MNADEIVRALKRNAEVNPHAAVMMMAADLIETLQAQLAASQARERAAVGSITQDCHTCLYGGCEWDEPPCAACTGGRVFSDGVKRTNNWEWRGPQDEEGDTE